MATEPVNTANTLSNFFRPGEDVRIGPNSSSSSIFTFGDYRIEKGSEQDTLTGSAQNVSFTPFSTLENMGVDNFNPNFTTSVKNNELKPKKQDPYSYTYFGSFYTEVARSINNIIDTFPYAVLAFDEFNNTTIYDYSQSYNNITGEKTSTFKIPKSVVINQGYVLFDSGSTRNNQKSLMTDTDLFEIQLSGSSSAQTISHKILTYSYHPGNNSYLEFKIDGHLSEGAVDKSLTGSTSTLPIYIRPSRKRMTEYRLNQTRLERQLLRDGLFDIPDIDSFDEEFTYRIEWPREIDGFNPDVSGRNFENYKENILLLASNVDIDKTDIMLKTMIPENYLEFDTKTEIYKKVVSSYAKQFDEIKHFIDNIAYAHSLNYNEEESIPEKFLVKFSNLLGWKLSSSFSEIDLFEYLADDETADQNSFAYYNVELWKRILININWLYKRKGTRDALQFLFRLMGAPECLVVFDEFVYEIQQATTTATTQSINFQDQQDSYKINTRGYINYNASDFVFQEGGPGRGDGQRYIKQWEPEFDPLKQNDNIKVHVGRTGVTGSEDIINTKETCITLSPANAIECDVFDWYKLSGTCWVWGSIAPYFSANTVPFEYTIDDCDFVAPERITGMTFHEYLEYIYTSNIEPRNRKTNTQSHTTWGYPNLKKIYMNYYLLSEPRSNKLTVKKLEAFLDLMEVNFQDYMIQLVPATTILECGATTYRNTIFHRQRYVYKQGINDGSEFQTSLPPELRPQQTPIQINTSVNDYLNGQINTIVVNSDVSQGINDKVYAVNIRAHVNQNNTNAGLDAVDILGDIQPGTTSTTVVP